MKDRQAAGTSQNQGGKKGAASEVGRRVREKRHDEEKDWSGLFILKVTGDRIATPKKIWQAETRPEVVNNQGDNSQE